MVIARNSAQKTFETCIGHGRYTIVGFDECASQMALGHPVCRVGETAFKRGIALIQKGTIIA
jgi:hypothetical protein